MIIMDFADLLAAHGYVFTLLIHVGYLAYGLEKNEVFIPNKEIIGEFENTMKFRYDEKKPVKEYFTSLYISCIVII